MQLYYENKRISSNCMGIIENSCELNYNYVCKLEQIEKKEGRVNEKINET